jgi:Tfp pilus assembly protein PilE
VNNPRTRGGFTIVEMMVVCAVALVILTLLADVFIVALKRTNDSRLKVDMQQRAIFALSRWERDIESTSAAAMTVRRNEPFCVAFTQVAAVNANGTLVWEDGKNPAKPENEGLICWAFLKDQGQLMRDTYPPRRPTFARDPSEFHPYLPTDSELEAMVQETSGAEKIMCGDVDDFSLTDRDGNWDLEKQPLLFRLKLRRPLSTPENFAEFTIERRYTLRNRYSL